MEGVLLFLFSPRKGGGLGSSGSGQGYTPPIGGTIQLTAPEVGEITREKVSPGGAETQALLQSDARRDRVEYTEMVSETVLWGGQDCVPGP